MRKFTFFLTMLFCTIGAVTASADTPDWATNKKLASIGTALTGSVTEGAYILATNSSWSRWLTAPSATGGQLGYVTSNSVTAPTLDLSTVFYIKPSTDSDGNTTYTFQLSDGDYIAQLTLVGTWGDPVVSSSTAGTFVITELDEDYYYAIKDTQNNYWIDHNSSGPVSWKSQPETSSESNGAYQLIPVTLEDATTVTVTYKVLDSDGNTLASQEVLSEVGAEASLPDELKRDYCEYGTLSETTISSTTTEITTTATWTLPFTPSTDIESNWDGANWYLLQNQRYSNYYCSYNESTNAAKISTTALSGNTILSSSDDGTYSINGCPAFAFVGNPYSGFKIYNYAAGSDKVLWSSTVDDEGTAISFTDVTEVTEGTDWELTNTTVTVDNNSYSYYTFKRMTTDYGYMNDRGNYISYWVSGWATTDKGSSFTFTAVDMSAISALAEAANNSQKYSITTTGELNKYVETTSGALQEALNAASALTYESTSDNISSATTAINNAISALNIAQPANGTFIRVQSTQSSLYLRAEASSAKSKRVVIGEKGTSESIFYYKDRHLLGFNNGYYLTPDNAQTAIDGIVSTYQTFDFLKSQDGSIGCYYIETNADDDTNKRWMYAYTDGKDYADCWGTSGTHTNCNFRLEQVTELPVSVTAAGYATLNAPVNLTIPDGVTVYYVSGQKTSSEDGKDYAVLTEITNTIPANTPVVLEASEGTYNFAITSDEASTIEDNKLAGLVAAENKSTAEGTTVYTLAYVDETPGFYKYTGSELKGFKAYYSVSAEQGAAPMSLLFNAGGATEGIATAVSEGEASEKAIYDLQGRRVKKAQKGVYIVDGKKIILK